MRGDEPNLAYMPAPKHKCGICSQSGQPTTFGPVKGYVGMNGQDLLRVCAPGAGCQSTATGPFDYPAWKQETDDLVASI